MFICYFIKVIIETTGQYIKSLLNACIEDIVDAVQVIVEDYAPGIDVNIPSLITDI